MSELNNLELNMNANINKTIIPVPNDIQYISQWAGYNFPKGHCVVDKGVTGCGYTEYALRNNENVILVSPRKLLLENKAEQHEGEINITYLKNDMKKDDYNTVINFYNRISSHVVNCKAAGLPIKFMITNDSAHYLIDHLKKLNCLNEFYLIADEFQLIFLDSFFKVDVENEFLESIQECKNIIYLSATPLQDEYLSKMEEFNQLPFYYLDWSNSSYVSKLMINRKHVGSLYTEACNIIRSFLEGDFPTIVTEDKRIIKSKEAVFYFNSVNEIVKIIKKFKLAPGQVNILCADTENNLELLKKIGHLRGKIPVKGEPNKMFTLCTSTCYVGADFYSDCASTYIFADPNLEHLALDISLDLPQIAGRQRNISNPFKNIINLFYKTKRKGDIITEEEFRNYQEEKREHTLNMLNSYKKANDEEKATLKMYVAVDKCYSVGFTSISKKEGLVYNKLIEISNERAFRIQQKDYQDDISVTRVIRESVPFLGDVGEYKNKFDEIIDHFMKDEFLSTGKFEIKLKYFCNFMDKYREVQYIRDQLRYKIPDLRFHNYYLLFGTAKCKALDWKSAEIERALYVEERKDSITNAFYHEFKVHQRYTRKHLKSKIAEIYRVLELNISPKASELEKYFEVKDVIIVDPITKKKDRGFEIIKKKELGED